MQCQTGNLTTHGVESAEDNRFGRIIHDDFYACGCFESADIATLATDDTTLNLVGIDVEHRYRIFYCRFGCHTLNRSHDDTFGLFRRREFRLLDRLVDVGGSLALGFGLHILDKTVFCLLRTHARDLFEPCILLAHQLRQLLLFVFESLHLTLHLLFQAVVVGNFALHLPLLVLKLRLNLLGTLLALVQTLIALIDLLVVLAFELYELLFCLQNLLFLNHFALILGLFQNRRRTHLYGIERCETRYGRYHNGDAYDNQYIHNLSLKLLLVCL